MAKNLIQVVTQDGQSGPLGDIPKRIIVQYEDTENGDDQILVNYDDMTTEAKAIYDTFIQMCEVYLTT